jgi:hypothetical protein
MVDGRFRCRVTQSGGTRPRLRLDQVGPHDVVGGHCLPNGWQVRSSVVEFADARYPAHFLFLF